MFWGGCRRRHHQRLGVGLLTGVGLLAAVHLLSQQRSLHRSYAVVGGAGAPAGAPAEDDWFDGAGGAPAGRRHNCFVVEDLCHSSNRWFYRDDSHKYQPNFRLAMMAPNDMAFRHYGYHSHYNATTRLSDHDAQVLGCVDDPTPNHVILHSLYNDMLGEFYTRSLLGLFVLLEEEHMPVARFARRSRLYLHRAEPLKSLLDSHRLFTDAFRSTALGDLTELLDAAPCRCLRRAAFCGYRVHGKFAVDADDTAYDPVEDVVELIPAAVSERAEFNTDNNRETAIYSRLRNFLRQQMIHTCPFVERDIDTIRRDLVWRHLEDAPSATASLPASEWKVIGLTQRSGRRRWQNLQQVLEVLGPRMLATGIALVEINVEDLDWTPYQQLIRHAALDGLIGIHGAQLTEAVWMKPGSLVVELLPYIPKGITHGEWTVTTDEPTPLGVIFDETNLLHVGYALERSSAPYCYDDESLECWKPSGNPWDERDFVVAPEVIGSLLEEFVMHRPAVCGDYRNLSRPDKRTVVYNAPCSDAPGRRLGRVAHFYWKPPSERRQSEMTTENDSEYRLLGVV